MICPWLMVKAIPKIYKQTKAVSSCTVIVKQPKEFLGFTKVSEHMGQPSCWPSEAKVWL